MVFRIAYFDDGMPVPPFRGIHIGASIPWHPYRCLHSEVSIPVPSFRGIHTGAFIP